MNNSTFELSTSELSTIELKELAAHIGAEREQAAQTYYQLRIVYNLLNRVGSADIESHGVHTAYYGVLYALRGGKEITPSQLRHYVLSGISNMTSLIDRMVRDGLVRRWRDEQDRRKVKICLTERGEEASRRVVAGHVDWVKKTMAVFKEQDLEQFNRLLGLLWQEVCSQANELGIEIAGIPQEVNGND
jgi:MarR family transcriptional regulator, organic hydroperoxide resistance regulator